jgi:hypothetical protein
MAWDASTGSANMVTGVGRPGPRRNRIVGYETFG